MGIASASTVASAPTRVRARTIERASAPSPVRSEASWIAPEEDDVDRARQGRRAVRVDTGELLHLAEDDVRGDPVRKPSITESETNRVYLPSRRTPAASIAAPARIVSRKSASARSAAGTSAIADPAASAAAEVVVITISFVLEVRPPLTGPANAA